MLKSGILNPGIRSLLARVRHTNTLVIADRGFPYWPGVETVDISLIDDIPQVLDVLRAVLPNFNAGQVYMAEEFLKENTEAVQEKFKKVFNGLPVSYESHVEFKNRVPSSIGLIRSADTTQYANVILESA